MLAASKMRTMIPRVVNVFMTQKSRSAGRRAFTYVKKSLLAANAAELRGGDS